MSFPWQPPLSRLHSVAGLSPSKEDTKLSTSRLGRRARDEKWEGGVCPVAMPLFPPDFPYTRVSSQQSTNKAFLCFSHWIEWLPFTARLCKSHCPCHYRCLLFTAIYNARNLSHRPATTISQGLRSCFSTTALLRWWFVYGNMVFSFLLSVRLVVALVILLTISFLNKMSCYCPIEHGLSSLPAKQLSL